MEKEFYSINELATMTGFTTRSLRNFIQMGHLNGEKIDGVWQFSPEQIDTFISNPNVAPGIRSKNNSVVFDFMVDNQKENSQICAILDLKLSMADAKECSEYFCNEINSSGIENAKLKLEMHGENARIIISGPEDFVTDAINGWYNK